MPPSLSVLVCTRDRASLLEGCLRSIAEQTGVDDLEIVVVDNGSTDSTRQVVERHPSVRCVHEPRPGLSQARNAGIEAAGAAWIAFLDDDARPRPGWAAALVTASERWPAAAAIGGPVHLRWAHEPPGWLVPALHRWYSAIDHGTRARLLDGGERVVGANLAVRRDAVLAAGGFADGLGRVGTALRSGEEVELVDRLRGAGLAVGWEPGAAVDHLIDAERMTIRWLLRRAWAQGRTDATIARLHGHPVRSSPRWRGIAGAVARRWPTAVRTIAGADHRGGACVVELVRRTRALGLQTLRDP